MSMPVNRTPTLGTSIVPLRIVATPPTCGCFGSPLIARSSASRPVALCSLGESASTRARSTLSAWIRPRSESLVGVAVNSVSAIG